MVRRLYIHFLDSKFLSQIEIIENNFSIFSRVHATLHLGLSVGRSVGPSVGPSEIFLNFLSFLTFLTMFKYFLTIFGHFVDELAHLSFPKIPPEQTFNRRVDIKL